MQAQAEIHDDLRDVDHEERHSDPEHEFPFGSRRFAEIRDLLPRISEKVLTAQLRRLEHDGMISRLVTETVPPRVDYMLTDAGKEPIPVMEAMCTWGTKHLGVAPNLPRPLTVPT